MNTKLLAWMGLSLLVFSGRILQAEDLKPFPDPQLMIDAKGFSGVTIKSLALSADGRWLAAGGGKEVRIWNLETGELRTTLRGYQEPMGYLTGRVNMVAFSPDSRYLIVGVSDNTEQGSTRIYDMQDLTHMQRLLAGHTGCALGVAFSPDGKYLATFGCDGHVYVFRWNDRGTGASLYIDCPEVFNEEQVDNNASQYFGFPVDSRWLVLRTAGKQMVLSTETRRAITDPDEWPMELRSLAQREKSLTVHPHGLADQFTTPTWLQADAALWYGRGGMSTDTNNVASYWIAVWQNGSSRPACIYEEHRFVPVAVAVNAGQQMAASADVFGDVHVWNTATGATRWKLEACGQQVYRVAWSPDSNKLRFAEDPYGPSQYNYNRFGPITKEFDLTNRHVTETGPVPDEPVLPSRWDPQSQTTVSLEPKMIAARREKSTCNSGEPVYELLVKSNSNPVAHLNMSQYGQPYAFCFARTALPRMLQLPFYLGTFHGDLLLGGHENGNFSVTQTFLGHNNAITAVAESPNGKLLATSSLDGTIRLWKIESPNVVGDVDFVADGNRVNFVPVPSAAATAGIRQNDEVLSFDNAPFYERMRRIVAGRYRPGQQVAIQLKREGQIINTQIMLRARGGVVEPLLTLFLDRKNEWVMWTETGHYDASSRGGQYVGWHVNQARDELAQFYPVSQFQKQLYRPDVISEVLRTRSVKEAMASVETLAPPAPRAQRANVDLRQRNSFADVQPPEVRIVEPTAEWTTRQSVVQVTAEVKSPGGLRIQEVSFRVNGRPAQGKPTSQNGTADSVLTCTQEITLTPGRNVISVQARHREATSNTDQVTVVCESPGPSTRNLPNLYVLSVGVSKHAQSRFNLAYADRDALDFAAAWKAQEGRMYNKVNTKVLTNEEATVGNIKDAMQWISHSAQDPNDVVLVLFAGHGVFDSSGQWYLATHEMDLEHLLRTTISYADITVWVDAQIRSHVVLFVDTCHAGAVRGTQHAQPLPTGLTFQAPRGVDLWRGSGTLVLASCLPQEASLEDQSWEHGAFTKAILQAVESPAADIDHDGQLTFDELELFVKREVGKLTAGQQNPSAHKPITISAVTLARLSP